MKESLFTPPPEGVYCKHCKEWQHRHVDEVKCLYQPTEYEPMSQEDHATECDKRFAHWLAGRTSFTR